MRWVLRAQSGERAAVDALMLAVQAELYRYLSGLVDDPVLAEDLLQDVLVLIYRNLRWLHQPALFRPWAFRIASREAFKVLRRKKRIARLHQNVPKLEGLHISDDPETVSPELVLALPYFIDQVSSASRAVLFLHYQHEMSLPEVAGILGIAVGTAKSRLAYGLASLRKNLAKHGFDAND